MVKFITSIYRDGYGFIGAVAPVISMFTSILKLLDVNMDWLQELSWGWVFAPLTAWLFVAYTRRWLSSQAYYNANPKPDMSAQDAFRHLMLYSKRSLGTNPETLDYYPDIEVDLRDHARSGDMKVWARKYEAGGAGGFRESRFIVPLEDFEHYKFELTSCVSDAFESARLIDYRTNPWTLLGDVEVNRRQLSNIWPKSNWWERLRDPHHRGRLDYFEKERKGNQYGAG